MVLAAFREIYEQEGEDNSRICDEIAQRVLFHIMGLWFLQEKLIKKWNQADFCAILAADQQFADLGWLLLQRNEDIQHKSPIPNPLIATLFSKLLDKYTFRIREHAMDIQSKIITPEILGLTYENLLDEEERGYSGTFFTPRAEIDFICRQTLFYYLRSETGIEDNRIVDLIYGNTNLLNFSKKECRLIAQLLQNINVIDPACGAGSFLVVLAEILTQVLESVCRTAEEEFDRLDVLQNIIESAIYGLDIKNGALEVAELRLGLLIVAEMPNGGVSDNPQSLLTLSTHLELRDAVLPQTEDLATKFDIVIGNPPYVRQRDIASPNANEENANVQYRQAILDNIACLYGDRIVFDPISDYYLYFYLNTFPLLKSGGIHAFIVSNSWLDVKFGFPFQEYICKNMRILAIVDSQRRSFDQARINTIISFLQVPATAADINQPVKFIYFKLALSDAISSEYMNIINAAAEDVESHPVFRIRVVPQDQLYNLGAGESGTYNGARWGNVFFRSPVHFYHLNTCILGEYGQKFLKIRDIGHLIRGFSTSCNEFFIVEKTSPTTFRNGYGGEYPLENEFLFPILRSPTTLSQPRVNAAQLTTFIVLTDKPKQQIQSTVLSEYIADGERQRIPIKKGSQQGRIITGVHNLPSFRARPQDRWYAKKGFRKRLTNLFFQKIYNTNYKVGRADTPIFLNNTFYGLYLSPQYKDSEDFIFASLLSSLTMLSIELVGRSNFGAGALDTAKNDIEDVWVLNPWHFSPEQRHRLIELSQKLYVRSYLPIQEELHSPDRIALDQYVLEMCGFEDFLLVDLYGDLLQVTTERLARAQTFKKGKNQV